jgi:hypothetical protein
MINRLGRLKMQAGVTEDLVMSAFCFDWSRHTDILARSAGNHPREVVLPRVPVSPFAE